MIAILTTCGDLSSDLVVKYLSNLNYPFCRINTKDLLDKGFGVYIQNNTVNIRVQGNNIDTLQIGAVWYRKFGFFKKSVYYKNISKKLNDTHLDNLSKEFSSVMGAIYGCLRNKQWLTNPYSANLNKIDVLLIARECGLKVAETFLITDKNQLQEISNRFALITKSARDPWLVRHNGQVFTMFTNEIRDIKILPEIFFPSLIQRKIPKQYEIRAFMLLDQLYVMAIFSQKDQQTQLDFRRYNWKSPNRFVPYLLPDTIKESLLRLCKRLNLNSCSIDLIRGQDGEYYFLEINPTGQFGMVDFPCNYGLHDKVAETLIALDKKGLYTNEESIY